MDFLEKDLEQIIFDNIKGDKLRRKGLNHRHPKILKRQLRIGNYGIADIVTFSKRKGEPPIITIYELKANTLSLNTLLQAGRYAKGIRRWIDKFKPRLELCLYFELRIVLIGKTCDISNDWIYLFDTLNLNYKVSIFTYKYNIDGISFNEVLLDEYSLKEEGF